MDGSLHPLRLVAVAVLAALALIAASTLVDAAESIGNTRKVVNKVYGATLNRTLRTGESLIENQPISTGAESATDLKFLDESTIYIGEQANLTLDNLIYDPRAKKVTGTLELSKGLLRFASAAGAKVDMQVKTPHGTLGIRGTVFDVLATPAASEIAVHEGQVAVATPFGAATVNAGEVFRATGAAPPAAQPAPSLEMRAGVKKMLALLDAPDFSPQQMKEAAAQKKETAQAVAALEGTPAFKQAIATKKPENLIYLDTTGGRIVIEMLPNLAPKHIARIRELVRAKFYDGQVFHNVVPGFAVETGDPTGSGTGGTGETLKAEISNTSFTRGIVGMKRMRTEIDTADSQFFITLGPARHLDGKYTAWGRVIFGLEVADKLKPGSPPPEPDRIVAMRLVADPDLGAQGQAQGKAQGKAQDKAKDKAVSVPCRDSDRRLGSC